MSILSVHPDERVLADFLGGALDGRKRSRIASHLQKCSGCRETLRFLTRVAEAHSAPAPTASAVILAAALAARAAGERRILPAADIASHGRGRSRRRGWVVVAASLIVAAYVALGRPANISAVAVDGQMRILPLAPKAGDTIRIAYRPGGATFGDADRLSVRAQLRVAQDPMYAVAGRVTRVATLTRTATGEYAGAFVLPDSIVFASMVVQDSDATVIDANNGKRWEVMVHDNDGQPTFDALDQRMNDMMGRSWEEAYATSKRITRMYPEHIDAWTTMSFFDHALFDEARAESLSTAYRGTIDRLTGDAKRKSALNDAEIGVIFFDRMARANNRKTGTAADSAEFEYWLERILREHPRHMQLAQYFGYRFTPEEMAMPRMVLDSLERLWARFAPLTGPGVAIVNVGQQMAAKFDDDALVKRWSARAYSGRSDSVYMVARTTAARPKLRDESMAALRRALATPSMMESTRRMEETRAEYTLRMEDERRTALAWLGRALIASGHTRAGLDTLNLAAVGAWNPGLFRSLRSAYATAHDTASERAMRARLAVDPRTAPDTVVSLTSTGRAQLGATAWEALVATARDEMHARLLARSRSKSLRGSPSLLDGSGVSTTLRAISRGAPAAVIFWSRNCGFAIQALPQIIETTARLRRDGRKVVFVVDEAPSAAVKALLAAKGWTGDTWYDARGEMKEAFSNFGTPSYYVLDGTRHIRFNAVDEVPDLIGQMDAVVSESR